jgi:hypothetical protein
MTASEMRMAVFLRDGACLAPRLDPDAGPCRDKWGHRLHGAASYLSPEVGEADYVRRDALAARHVLPEDCVWLCPGHHRGTGATAGYVWATAHRDELVAYLAPLRAKATHEHRYPQHDDDEGRCVCGHSPHAPGVTKTVRQPGGEGVSAVHPPAPSPSAEPVRGGGSALPAGGASLKYRGMR